MKKVILNSRIVTIGIGDFVKETRNNKVGVVTDINEKLNRFLLDFPDTNSFGWFGLKEIKHIEQLNINSKKH